MEESGSGGWAHTVGADVDGGRRGAVLSGVRLDLDHEAGCDGRGRGRMRRSAGRAARRSGVPNIPDLVTAEALVLVVV
jgi:hypothetical protein